MERKFLLIGLLGIAVLLFGCLNSNGFVPLKNQTVNQSKIMPLNVSQLLASGSSLEGKLIFVRGRAVPSVVSSGPGMFCPGGCCYFDYVSAGLSLSNGLSPQDSIPIAGGTCNGRSCQEVENPGSCMNESLHCGISCYPLQFNESYAVYALLRRNASSQETAYALSNYFYLELVNFTRFGGGIDEK